MGDNWDYKLRKLEMAWELASRIMPMEARDIGEWAPDGYLKQAQQVLTGARDVVDAVFSNETAVPKLH